VISSGAVHAGRDLDAAESAVRPADANAPVIIIIGGGMAGLSADRQYPLVPRSARPYALAAEGDHLATHWRRMPGVTASSDTFTDLLWLN